MQETILCYNLNKERKTQVEELAKALEIDVKHVENQDFSAPLGALCGVLENTKSEKSSEKSFEDEMMVLCFFEDDKFRAFLSSFKKNNIKPVALKAVLTPHNAVWNGIELHKNLFEEHMYFMRQRKI
jgi:hypothetical protein